MSAGDEAPLAGIDVSHFQGEVDWGAVAAAGVRFAFIKATEGLDDVDPRFAQNWQGSRAAGLLRGAYHFLHPNLDARQQAAHFLVGRHARRRRPAAGARRRGHQWRGARDVGRLHRGLARHGRGGARLQARGLYRSLVLAR